MRKIKVKAGEKDVFIALEGIKGEKRYYEVQSSAKKNSAQLVKADLRKIHK